MGGSASKPSKRTPKTKKNPSPNPNIATKDARNKTKAACQATQKACKAAEALDDAGLKASCKEAMKDCKDVLKRQLH